MASKVNQILIVGYYGFGNIGDEAILSTLIKELRSFLPGIAIVVVSGNVTETKSSHHVKSIPFDDIASIVNEVNESDLIILGGGGLFQDYYDFEIDNILTSNYRGISFYSTFPLLATILDKPFMIYSVGVGPLFTKMGKHYTRLAFEQSWLTTVRDKESKKLLEDLGIKKKLHLTADPSFCLDISTKEHIQSLIKEEGLSLSNSPLIGVSVREWIFNCQPEKYVEKIAHALDVMIEKQRLQVLFIPFQKQKNPLENDYQILEKIRNFMKHKDGITILKQNYSPNEIAGIISLCDVVLGMRLHSIIFAASTGVPVVSLAYDPKVRHIMKEIKCENYILDINSFTSSELVSLLEVALKNRQEIRKKMSPNVKQMKQLVQHNSQLVMSILHGKVEYNKTLSEEMESFLKKILLNLALKYDQKQKLASIDINSKSEQIKTLEKDLITKDEKITNLEEEILTKDEQIKTLEKDLITKDEKITNLEEEILTRKIP